MPSTSVYGFEFENLGDEPGRTLTGGESATSPILAEQVEAELVRVDDSLSAVEGIVAPTEDYQSYTPTFVNTGSATFSNLQGRWRRIAPGTIHWIAYFVVGTAGSGSNPVGINSPTNPTRSTRQMVSYNGEGLTTPGLRFGYAVTFTGSSGTIWDRIRVSSGEANPAIVNLTGAMLESGSINLVQGIYREEMS